MKYYAFNTHTVRLTNLYLLINQQLNNLFRKIFFVCNEKNVQLAVLDLLFYFIKRDIFFTEIKKNLFSSYVSRGRRAVEYHMIIF
jgi:hypothetical protein